MSNAKSLCRIALLALVASTVLLVADAPAAEECKPAGPLPQSKCVKDAQCCKGLVCEGGRCQAGCHIAGVFKTSGQKNAAPNNCQSCQPSASTTGWTNVASGTSCRLSAGVCDTAETCSGTSGACPPDGKSTAVCRSAQGPCDVAESCDGANNVPARCLRPLHHELPPGGV